MVPVADGCSNAMLELAPEYFRYMQSTHNKATSLVKIAGFFSGESLDDVSRTLLRDSHYT
jgi:hypothetical protein